MPLTSFVSPNDVSEGKNEPWAGKQPVLLHAPAYTAFLPLQNNARTLSNVREKTAMSADLPD